MGFFQILKYRLQLLIITIPETSPRAPARYPPAVSVKYTMNGSTDDIAKAAEIMHANVDLTCLPRMRGRE